MKILSAITLLYNPRTYIKKFYFQLIQLVKLINYWNSKYGWLKNIFFPLHAILHFHICRRSIYINDNELNWSVEGNFAGQGEIIYLWSDIIKSALGWSTDLFGTLEFDARKRDRQTDKQTERENNKKETVNYVEAWRDAWSYNVTRNY